MNQDDTEDRIYKVVVNHEEQYSVWVGSRPNPAGWNDAGKSGSKSECLAFIEEVWTDMRPLTLRTAMQKPIGKDENSLVDFHGHQTNTRGSD
jgi:MbtH protein